MTIHCPTCTCEESESEPRNECEVSGSMCEGTDHVVRCYACGLAVCMSPGCSVLTRYKVVIVRGWSLGGRADESLAGTGTALRKCRICLNCIETWMGFGAIPEFDTEKQIRNYYLRLAGYGTT